MSKLIRLLLVLAVSLGVAGRASATPTATGTATNTPTVTNTPTITGTPTITPTPTPTPTIVRAGAGGSSLLGRAGERRLDRMNNYSSAAKEADLADIATSAVRSVNRLATNATAFQMSDVRTVVAIYAFVASTRAPATKTLLEENTDFTVSNGDITPIGDHSTEVWVVLYRP